MDIEHLFKPRLPEEELDLPGVGVIRIRGLNRDEVLAVGKLTDVGERDRHLIAIGMVDPRLSVQQVRQWGAAATGGELERVSRAIAGLSGMLEDSAKSSYKSDGDDGAGVRALSGGATVHDSGPAQNGDE